MSKGSCGLKMTLEWNEEEKVFVQNYLDDDKSIFQVKMLPEHFELMTADFIRTIKNYNLYQAQQYQKRMEKTNERRNQEKIEMDNGKKAPFGIEGPS